MTIQLCRLFEKMSNIHHQPYTVKIGLRQASPWWFILRSLHSMDSHDLWKLVELGRHNHAAFTSARSPHQEHLVSVVTILTHYYWPKFFLSFTEYFYSNISFMVKTSKSSLKKYLCYVIIYTCISENRYKTTNYSFTCNTYLNAIMWQTRVFIQKWDWLLPFWIADLVRKSNNLADARLEIDPTEIVTRKSWSRIHNWNGLTQFPVYTIWE